MRFSLKNLAGQILNFGDLKGTRIVSKKRRSIKTDKKNKHAIIQFVNKFYHEILDQTPDKMLENLEQKYKNYADVEELMDLSYKIEQKLNKMLDKELISQAEFEEYDNQLVYMKTLFKLKELTEKIGHQIKNVTMDDMRELNQCFSNLDQNPSEDVQREHDNYVDQLLSYIGNHINEVKDKNVAQVMVELLKARSDLENSSYADQIYEAVYGNEFKKYTKLKNNLDELSDVSNEKDLEKFKDMITNFVQIGTNLNIYNEASAKALLVLQNVEISFILKDIESLKTSSSLSEVTALMARVDEFKKLHPRYKFKDSELEKIQTLLDRYNELEIFENDKDELETILKTYKKNPKLSLEDKKQFLQSCEQFKMNYPEYKMDASLENILNTLREDIKSIEVKPVVEEKEPKAKKTATEQNPVIEEKVEPKVISKPMESKPTTDVDQKLSVDPIYNQSVQPLLDLLKTCSELTSQMMKTAQQMQLGGDVNLLNQISNLRKTANETLHVFNSYEKGFQEQKNTILSNLQDGYDQISKNVDTLESDTIIMKANELLKNVDHYEKYLDSKDIENYRNQINHLIEIGETKKKQETLKTNTETIEQKVTVKDENLDKQQIFNSFMQKANELSSIEFTDMDSYLARCKELDNYIDLYYKTSGNDETLQFMMNHMKPIKDGINEFEGLKKQTIEPQAIAQMDEISDPNKKYESENEVIIMDIEHHIDLAREMNSLSSLAFASDLFLEYRDKMSIRQREKIDLKLKLAQGEIEKHLSTEDLATSKEEINGYINLAIDTKSLNHLFMAHDMYISQRSKYSISENDDFNTKFRYAEAEIRKYLEQEEGLEKNDQQTNENKETKTIKENLSVNRDVADDMFQNLQMRLDDVLLHSNSSKEYDAAECLFYQYKDFLTASQQEQIQEKLNYVGSFIEDSKEHKQSSRL